MPREPLERLKELQESARERVQAAQDRVKELEPTAAELRQRANAITREMAAVLEERRKAAEEAMPPGLATRVLSSLVGIPPAPLAHVRRGQPEAACVVFTAGVAVIALLSAGEYFRGLKHRGFRPNDAVAYVGVVILQFAAWSVSRGEVGPFLPVLLVVLTIATLSCRSSAASRSRSPIWASPFSESSILAGS